VRIDSTLPGWPATRVRETLRGLPAAHGYRVIVKPLRYRTRPHLQALCDFDDHTIAVQVPEPFLPFTERVPHRARRVAGRGSFAFRWEVRDVRFRTRREVIRFLYLHEYYHWYLREILGRRSAAETACDRFALAGFRRRLPVPAPDEAGRRDGGPRG
jgi:hypothetical protein